MNSCFKVMGEKDGCCFNLMMSGFFFFRFFFFLNFIGYWMVLTDEENFLTPTALETRHCIFSFPRKAAVPTSKRSFAPWFLPALAHPAGDRTGANACYTETMLFIPKKQLACAWPPVPCQTRGGCIYLLVPFPLFTRSVGVSRCMFWGGLVYCKKMGSADPSENNEASRWF